MWAIVAARIARATKVKAETGYIKLVTAYDYIYVQHQDRMAIEARDQSHFPADPTSADLIDLGQYGRVPDGTHGGGQ